MNYENLPIYKESYNLLLSVYRFTAKIQRAYRYTLAQELVVALQDLCTAIYKTNTLPDRLGYLGEAKECLVRVKLLMRVMRDLSLLGVRQQIEVVERIATISKQLKGWEAYLTKQARSKTKEKGAPEEALNDESGVL